MHADTFEDALVFATDAIREISGFARVKIYRFLADWSGEVIAESSDGKLQSYLGLCFPASDIPKQVRAIMEIVPYRAIGTPTDDALPILAADGYEGELDLTWSVLRSVSSMHTQYLRNIGVGAAFSTSLMHQRRLWGLIAAHNDTPGLLPFDSWSLLQEIGTAVMLRFDQQRRTETTNMISQLRKIENQFSSALRSNGDIEDVLLDLVPVLRKFLGADGFAFQYGSNLHVSGKAPTLRLFEN
ncbi:MAG: GAF domain-containing protein [Congregibacter sp.]